MDAKIMTDVPPNTLDVWTGPHPKASLAAGANAVSILNERKQLW
jgi:hypothetical protein